MQNPSLIISSFIICSSYYQYIFIERDLEKITQGNLYLYVYIYVSIYLFFIQYRFPSVQKILPNLSAPH